MQTPETSGNKVEPSDAAPPRGREEPLVLADVYLLTAESGGNVAVPGLTVTFDGSGLTVRKPDGSIGAVVTWADVSALTAEGRVRTPAGSPGVVVQAATTTRTHRFVVPSDNPAGLEHEIDQLAVAHVAKGPAPGPVPDPGGRRRMGLLVAVLAAAVVVGAVLVILVATGTVKF
jgi:hypothetical protein